MEMQLRQIVLLPYRWTCNYGCAESRNQKLEYAVESTAILYWNKQRIHNIAILCFLSLIVWQVYIRPDNGKVYIRDLCLHEVHQSV